MYKHFFTTVFPTLCALLLLSVAMPQTASAQTKKTKKKPAVEVRKVTWVSPMEVDLGDIPQGKPVNTKFVFRNITQQPIFLDNVRTSCGCTASEWSFMNVAPNDTSSIDITYDAKQEGYFKKSITVFVHGQRKSEDLIISGTVVIPPVTTGSPAERHQ